MERKLLARSRRMRCSAYRAKPACLCSWQLVCLFASSWERLYLRRWFRQASSGPRKAESGMSTSMQCCCSKRKKNKTDLVLCACHVVTVFTGVPVLTTTPEEQTAISSGDIASSRRGRVRHGCGLRWVEPKLTADGLLPFVRVHFKSPELKRRA